MSKTEAGSLRVLFKSQIRAGTFTEAGETTETPTDSRLTFGDVADRYREKHVPFDRGRPRREPGAD